MFFILSSQDLRGLIIEKIPVLTFIIPFHFILGTSKGKSIVYTSTPFFRQLLLIVFGIQLQIVNSLVQRGDLFLTS